MTDRGLDVHESLRAWARTLTATGRHPGHAITREEHDQLCADRDRPLTQSPVLRHRHSDNHHDLGEFL